MGSDGVACQVPLTIHLYGQQFPCGDCCRLFSCDFRKSTVRVQLQNRERSVPFRESAHLNRETTASFRERATLSREKIPESREAAAHSSIKDLPPKPISITTLLSKNPSSSTIWRAFLPVPLHHDDPLRICQDLFPPQCGRPAYTKHDRILQLLCYRV